MEAGMCFEFYPELEARDTIYLYPSTHAKTQNTFWLP